MIIMRIQEKYKTPNLVSASIKCNFCYANPLLFTVTSPSLDYFIPIQRRGHIPLQSTTDQHDRRRMPSRGMWPKMGQLQALLYKENWDQERK